MDGRENGLYAWFYRSNGTSFDSARSENVSMSSEDNAESDARTFGVQPRGFMVARRTGTSSVDVSGPELFCPNRIA
jgi:hypothetical protein